MRQETFAILFLMRKGHHSEANLKYMDLEKKSKTSYAKWFPSVEKEAQEWGELRQRLGSGQSSVVSYFLNITAFCKAVSYTHLDVYKRQILLSVNQDLFCNPGLQDQSNQWPGRSHL